MSYLDRWGITITKISRGVYEASLDGKTVTLDLRERVTDDEEVDAADALWQLISSLLNPYPDDEAYVEPPEPWHTRRAYAHCRWKMLGYQRLINLAPGNQRAPIRAKRDVWVAEEARLKALMGSDA